MFSRNHFSARSIRRKSSSVLASRGSFGFAFFSVLSSLIGVHAVTVDGHVETFLFQQGKSVDNGEEFADIVGSIHRPEVKDS